jgi:hypothetical protein
LVDSTSTAVPMPLGTGQHDDTLDSVSDSDRAGEGASFVSRGRALLSRSESILGGRLSPLPKIALIL